MFKDLNSVFNFSNYNFLLLKSGILSSIIKSLETPFYFKISLH